jgi:hypothetical protein
MNNLLSTDEEIINILNNFISDINICKDILNLKKNIENKLNIEYHKYLYKNIAELFFNIIKYQKKNIQTFSIIFTNKNYIAIPDYNMSFFNYTGISYQIKELINNLILDINDTKLFKENDKLYKILSDEITIKNKEKLNNHIG